MATFIVGMIIVIIVGAAVVYIIKEKKKGVKCIGCPEGATCSGSCASCGGACHTQCMTEPAHTMQSTGHVQGTEQQKQDAE